MGQQAFQRSYIAPPASRRKRLASCQARGVLRAGFDPTMGDAQYLADAEKMRIDISPLPGTKVRKIVQKLYAAPGEVIERARAAIRP